MGFYFLRSIASSCCSDSDSGDIHCVSTIVSFSFSLLGCLVAWLCFASFVVVIVVVVVYVLMIALI